MSISKLPQSMLRNAARLVRSALPNAAREKIARTGLFFAGEKSPLRAGNSFPSLKGSLEILRAHGFDPKMAIDIGACDGDWMEFFRGIFPQCHVFMIEARESKRERLQALRDRLQGSVDFRIALLGATSGNKVTFAEMGSGSSVYNEQSPYRRTSDERTTQTLDELRPDKSRDVDLIKLDVQGYELEVLRGAVETLRQTKVVQLEASFLPINEGAPMIGEITQFMDAHGFRLFDFCSQLRRKDGVLWQSDLLFVRVDSGLLPEPKLTPENWYYQESPDGTSSDNA